jgi:hypothetical protein
MIWNYYHFLRQNIEFTKNEDTFKNSYLFKNNEEKNMSCIWTTINIYYNNLKKKMFQNSFIWKSSFWQKGHAIFFSNNPFGHCISFAPIRCVLEMVVE